MLTKPVLTTWRTSVMRVGARVFAPSGMLHTVSPTCRMPHILRSLREELGGLLCFSTGAVEEVQQLLGTQCGSLHYFWRIS